MSKKESRHWMLILIQMKIYSRHQSQLTWNTAVVWKMIIHFYWNFFFQTFLGRNMWNDLSLSRSQRFKIGLHSIFQIFKIGITWIFTFYRDRKFAVHEIVLWWHLNQYSYLSQWYVYVYIYMYIIIELLRTL